MKTYKPLIIPNDSSWGKFTIRRYLPYWFLNFIDGICNIIKWIPTLYKNRDWDHNYIYELIKIKLIQQRAYLVKHNRHMGILDINKYITICLNLIERLQEDYYGLEYMDYEKSKYEFIPCINNPGYSKLKSEIIEENLSDYLNKYTKQTKKFISENTDFSVETPEGRKSVAIRISNRNHERCKSLLFKILNEKIESWWD